MAISAVGMMTTILLSLMTFSMAAPQNTKVITYDFTNEEENRSQFMRLNNGTYSWGYDFPGQAHKETRNGDGSVEGSYRYVDANGVPVLVNYQSDPENGYTADITKGHSDISDRFLRGRISEVQSDQSTKGRSTLRLQSSNSEDVFGRSITGTAIGLAGAATSVSGLLSNTEHKNYGRRFEMKVANYLKWDLTQAKSFAWYGYISSAPKSIRPCTIDAFAGHKNGYTATGTSGIASWRINEVGVTIVVLWSVPYDASGPCNSMGLAIYRDLSSDEPNYSSRYNYFYDLYHYSDNFSNNAESETATIINSYRCYSTNEFCTSNVGIRVCGSYSTNSAATYNLRIEHTDKPLKCNKQSNSIS